MTTNRNGRPEALLPLRTALIFLSSILTGIGVASLLMLDHQSAAQAALLGIAAFAGALKFFHWLIG